MDILQKLGYEKVKEVTVDQFAKAKEVFNKLKLELPETRALTLKQGSTIYAGISILGICIGSAIATYVFFGTVTLAGFVALVESNKYLRYCVSKSNKFIDMSLFAATIFATASLGITVSASLTMAGLGYTLVYAPYLRNKTKKQ